MITIKAKIHRAGSTYAMYVPKALVECGVLKNGGIYELQLKGEVLKTPDRVNDTKGSLA